MFYSNIYFAYLTRAVNTYILTSSQQLTIGLHFYELIEGKNNTSQSVLNPGTVPHACQSSTWNNVECWRAEIQPVLYGKILSNKQPQDWGGDRVKNLPCKYGDLGSNL